MQTIKWSADNKRRYASREGSIPPVLLSEVSKGAYPLAHDFPLGKSSVLYLSGADGSRNCSTPRKVWLQLRDKVE